MLENTFREGILFCLVGPAGGGKTTVGQYLLKSFSDSLSVSISVTSRQPRSGEVDGQSYHFISREQFEKRITANEFFEWEEVHKNLYGTLKSNLEGAIKYSKDLLLIIDIRGALNIKKNYPQNTVICFLAPPSLDVLKQRLKARGDISEEEYVRRLNTCKEEYQKLSALHKDSLIDYLVINDTLQDACEAVDKVFSAEKLRLVRHKSGYIKSIID